MQCRTKISITQGSTALQLKWRIFSRTSSEQSGKNKKSWFFLLGLKYTLRTCFESKYFLPKSCPVQMICFQLFDILWSSLDKIDNFGEINKSLFWVFWILKSFILSKLDHYISKSWKRIVAHAFETNTKFGRLENWVPDCSAEDRILAKRF